MKFIVKLIGDNNSRFEVIKANSYNEALFLARVKYPEFNVDDEVYVETIGLKKWFSERGVFL